MYKIKFENGTLLLFLNDVHVDTDNFITWISGGSLGQTLNVFHKNNVAFRFTLNYGSPDVVAGGNFNFSPYYDDMQGGQLDIDDYVIDQSVYDAIEFCGSSSGGTVDLTEVNTKLDNIITKVSTTEQIVSDNINYSLSGIAGYCDDTLSLTSQINNKINNNLDGKISDISVDLTPVTNSLGSIDTKINGLDTKLDNLDFDTSSLNGIEFISLNGSSGSIKDNQQVTIDGFDGVYTVVSSQMLKNDVNQYLIIYKVSKDNKYSIVPSNMVHISQS